MISRIVTLIKIIFVLAEKKHDSQQSHKPIQIRIKYKFMSSIEGKCLRNLIIMNYFSIAD